MWRKYHIAKLAERTRRMIVFVVDVIVVVVASAGRCQAREDRKQIVYVCGRYRQYCGTVVQC